MVINDIIIFGGYRDSLPPWYEMIKYEIANSAKSWVSTIITGILLLKFIFSGWQDSSSSLRLSSFKVEKANGFESDRVCKLASDKKQGKSGSCNEKKYKSDSEQMAASPTAFESDWEVVRE